MGGPGYSFPNVLADEGQLNGSRIMSQSELISLISLVANPTQYQGKQVRVIGCLRAQFEATGLFVSEADSRHAVTKNGIWLEIEAAAYSQLDGSYVVVEGLVDATSQGHLGLWSGTIRGVARLDRWTT